jgi:hypothetical protein
MQQLRELLPGNLWQQMNRRLGQEETLRLLWPALVGPRLAAQTYPRQLRGKTLVVAIPDREWLAPLGSLESTILETLHRFLGRSSATSVELVVDQSLCLSQERAGVLRPKRDPQPLGELPASEAIEDAGLREAFLRSAQKYFDRPQDGHGKELSR